MPIYEYVCTACQEVFAVFLSITASDTDVKCPKCGSGEVKKKVSSFCSIGGGAGSSGGFGGG